MKPAQDDKKQTTEVLQSGPKLKVKAGKKHKTDVLECGWKLKTKAEKKLKRKQKRQLALISKTSESLKHLKSSPAITKLQHEEISSSTEKCVDFASTHKPRKHLLIKPGKWLDKLVSS